MSLHLLGHQIEALVSLRKIFGERQCVLIGAAALLNHIWVDGETKDVDLAVVIPEADLPAVLEGAGWRQDKLVAHRWYSSGDAAADILPASEELITRGEIRFEKDEKIMSLVGFDLALKHTTEENLPGTEMVIEVAKLPVLAILKMVAWLECPAERQKDLGHLAKILEKALPVDDERRWEEPVLGSGLDDDCVSAFFVGREVAAMALPAHRSVVERFLAKVEPPASREFAEMSREAKYQARDPDGVLSRRLAAFRQGLGPR